MNPYTYSPEEWEAYEKDMEAGEDRQIWTWMSTGSDEVPPAITRKLRSSLEARAALGDPKAVDRLRAG